MSDLEKYLRKEYRDADFRLYELRNQGEHRGRHGWVPMVATLAGLCFFIVNFLYWSP